MKHKKKIALVALLAALVVAVPLSLGCCRTDLQKATWDARPGRVLGDGAVIVYSAQYEVNLWGLEQSHSFDIHKYRKMAQALVDGGYLTMEDFVVPEEATREQLLLVHTPEYLDKLKKSRNVASYLEVGSLGLLPGFVIDSRLLRPFRTVTGGTIVAAQLAMEHGLGINLGGGYHHAHTGHGEGFCIFADVPIAIRQLQSEGLARRVLLVDLDVHQGNGNASIFAGDDNVFTYSIHQENIYPNPKATSDLDRGLLPPVDDKAYMDVLERDLPGLLDSHKPDLVVLMAGVDTFVDDPLAGFSMTAEGIIRRDEFVVAQSRHRNIPVLYVTSGGYSEEAWQIQYRSIANLLEQFAGAQPRER